MGFLSYYRAFIPHFATLTAPLTDLLRGKNKKIEWTKSAEEATDGSQEEAVGCLCQVCIGLGTGKSSHDRCQWDGTRGNTRAASGRGRLGTSCLLVTKNVCSRNPLFGHRPRVVGGDRGCN